MAQEVLESEIISIHAPREGGDHATCVGASCVCISIHAPREGGDTSSKSA